MVIRAARPQPGETRLPLESAESRPAGEGRPVSIAVALLGGAAAGLVAHLAARTSYLGSALAVLAGLAAFALIERRVRASRVTGHTRAWLAIDDVGLARLDVKGRTPVARWGDPFGLAVLANTARSRALLAFTTPAATRFLRLRLESAKDSDAARELMSRAITVPDADLELAAPTSDLFLGAGSARVLLEELSRRDEQALRRIYLSDARGVAIALDGDSLEIDGYPFDLSGPVDWRVFTFHEGDASVLTLYQATAIRQGSKEVTLVCRAPAELASWAVGRAADAPPPRETRVAIDRLFMTPLRAALERAPRVSRAGQPPRIRRKSVQT